MKRYILHIITFFAALLVADVAWGQSSSEDWNTMTISGTKTVSLTGNVNIKGTITISKGATLTINGAGNKINVYAPSVSDKTYYSFAVAGTLIINNAILDGGNTGVVSDLPQDGDGENMSISSDGWTKSSTAIYVQAGGEAIIGNNNSSNEYDVTIQNMYGAQGTSNVGFINVDGPVRGTDNTTPASKVTMNKVLVQNCLNHNDCGIIYATGTNKHTVFEINNSKITNCAVKSYKTGRGYGGVIKGAGKAQCFLTMNNTIMQHCWSSGWGGAILWAASAGGCKAVFNNCTFQYNYARYLGGAVSSEATADFNNCELMYNVAGYGGGAIAAFPFTLADDEGSTGNAVGISLTDNKIHHNRTLHKTNANHTLNSDNTDNTIIKNKADYGFNPRFTINDASDNTYPSGGGAIWVLMNKDKWDCELTIKSGNEIYNNNSANEGGAVLLYKQKPFVSVPSSTSGYYSGMISIQNNYTGNSGKTSMTIAAELYNNESEYSGGGAAVASDAGLTAPSVTVSASASIYENRANLNGGGIYLPGGNVIMEGGSISDNSSNDKGGGVYLGNGNLTISSNKAVEFTANTSKYGGAAYVAGSMTIDGTLTILDNIVNNDGGGIYLQSGQFAVNGTAILKGNEATDQSGGGIYLGGGSFTVSQNGVLNLGGTTAEEGNTAGQNGGGVFCGAPFTVNGTSTIQNNSAANGGGVYINTGYSASFAKQMSLLNNTATGDGGGLYVAGGSVTIAQNTISGNNAKNGGAVYLTGGSVKATGASTIQNNYSSENGGAYYVSGGSVTMTSATISGNGKNNGTATTTNGGAVFVTGNGAGFTASGATEITSNASKGDGGAIYVAGGNINLVNNTISSNGAKNGGAVYIENGTFTANGTTEMRSNTADANGGSVYVKGGNIKVTGGSSVLTLSGNNASNGGVFYVNGGSITANEISEATISNNYSTAAGGAFYVTGGNINLCKTILSGNGRDGSLVKTKNGGAIALYNGTFSFADGSEIRDNHATDNGGGLYIYNSQGATKVNIECLGGSYINNTAALGGALYAEGPITLTFAANVRDNIAKNGGGLYLDGGVNMSFGNGLIVGNRAEVEQGAARDASQYGVGGGIYLNNGTLSFTEAQNLGIYNNAASYEAADIYASGDGTTINLPNVKGMNLTGFDVPGSELYWVNDFNEVNPSKGRYGRYEAALRNLDVNIEEMILEFNDEESEKKLDDVTCLDLGYDLVFVTLSSLGLDTFDAAGLSILYDKQGIETEYRKIVLMGAESKRVGLPSGDWKFNVTPWAKKYKSPVITPTPPSNGYINIKREENVILNDNITFKFEKVEGAANVTTYDYKKVNKMVPGGSASSSN